MRERRLLYRIFRAHFSPSWVVQQLVRLDVPFLPVGIAPIAGARGSEKIVTPCGVRGVWKDFTSTTREESMLSSGGNATDRWGERIVGFVQIWTKNSKVHLLQNSSESWGALKMARIDEVSKHSILSSSLCTRPPTKSYVYPHHRPYLLVSTHTLVLDTPHHPVVYFCSLVGSAASISTWKLKENISSSKYCQERYISVMSSHTAYVFVFILRTADEI